MSKWQWSQLVGFQCFWFVAVWSQNSHWWWLVLLLMGHFLFTPSRRQDGRVMTLAGLGMAVDGLLTWSGVFVFSGPPVWLLLLWLGFVLTLGHSMRWLSRQSVLGLMVIGALAGPSSYIAGWRLAAVELPLGLGPSLLILAVVWAGLLPLLVRGDRHLRQGAH